MLTNYDLAVELFTMLDQHGFDPSDSDPHEENLTIYTEWPSAAHALVVEWARDNMDKITLDQMELLIQGEIDASNSYVWYDFDPDRALDDDGDPEPITAKPERLRAEHPVTKALAERLVHEDDDDITWPKLRTATFPDGSQILITEWPNGLATAARRTSRYEVWSAPQNLENARE